MGNRNILNIIIVYLCKLYYLVLWWIFFFWTKIGQYCIVHVSFCKQHLRNYHSWFWRWFLLLLRTGFQQMRIPPWDQEPNNFSCHRKVLSALSSTSCGQPQGIGNRDQNSRNSSWMVMSQEQALCLSKKWTKNLKTKSWSLWTILHRSTIRTDQPFKPTCNEKVRNVQTRKLKKRRSVFLCFLW